MDSQMLTAVVARGEAMIEGFFSGFAGLTADHLAIGVGVLIWIQLVRLTTTMSSASKGGIGEQRVRNLEGELKQLTREVHALHGYISTNVQEPTGRKWP